MANAGGKKRADLKVVLLGAANVGKTALVHRYMDGKFVNPENTVGASFYLKQWRTCNIAIWDTAGQERYAGLSQFYCRSAGAAILAFDVTAQETLEALWDRFLPLLESAEPNCLCVVVATKSDLLSETPERVPMELGVRFAKSLNRNRDLSELPYFETSSMTGQNVEHAFEFIFQTVLPQAKQKQEQVTATTRSKSTVDLNSTGNTPQGQNVHSKCC